MKFIKWLCDLNHCDNYRASLQIFIFLAGFIAIAIVAKTYPHISVPIIFIATIVLTYFKYKKKILKMINFIQENLLLVIYVYMVFITMFAVCTDKLTINNIAWSVVAGLFWPILIPVVCVYKLLKV